MIARLFNSEWDNGYLSLYLSLPLLRQYFESYSIGAIMDSLSSDTLLAMPLVVPSLSEQQEIVAFVRAFVEKNDYIINQIRLQIQKLFEYRQALITAAVTGKIDVIAVESATECVP